MSDFNSSLPIRTENNGDAVVAICDGTISSQKLAVDAAGKVEVKLDDKDGNGISSQANGSQRALDVGINVAGVQVDPRDTRALTNSDVVTAEQGGTWDIGTVGTITNVVHVDDNGGSLTVDGTVAATQSGTWNINDISGTISLPTGAATEATLSSIDGKLVDGNDIGDVTVNNGAGAAAVNIQDGGNSITVDASALDIRPLTSADVVSAYISDDTGTPYSVSNPLPVNVVASLPGTDVLDYQTTSAVAAGASVDHDYTVTAGKTLSLQQISASASGKIKVEMKINGATKVVKFSSTAEANIDHSFNRPQEIAAGVVVRVTITNLDKQAQDVYSTVEGYEY